MRKGGNKTKKGRKRKADEANLAEVDDEEAGAEGGRKELVNLEDIEMIYKKKRHDKEVRDIYSPLNTSNSLSFFSDKDGRHQRRQRRGEEVRPQGQKGSKRIKDQQAKVEEEELLNDEAQDQGEREEVF